MSQILEIIDFSPYRLALPGLVRLHDSARNSLSLDEEIAVREAESIGKLDYIFFRRFSDGRSSQVAAYVIDNQDERLSKTDIAHIHQNVWLNGSTPLLYVSWPTQIDILSCARGPDFWANDDYRYWPAGTISKPAQNSVNPIVTAAEVSKSLEESNQFSLWRLSDGTFWDDPRNSDISHVEQGAHQRLIDAIIEADTKLDGKNRPALRQLLLLTILIKYLEDRGVFDEAENWFSQFHGGAKSFFDVLRNGTPDKLKTLLSHLESKFEGDIFCLPEGSVDNLTNEDLRKVLSTFVEAKTLREQRYLWDAYSFQNLPVEVLSHLYQHFADYDQGAIYTPPFVASLILDFALPYNQIKGDERILDPTCGSGVFLVGAFRRLVNHWRSCNGWQSPNVSILKAILKHSVFGVELQEDSLHLASFSLALAVCDFLKPKVIWHELQFDRLEGTNLLQEDFFEFVERSVPDSSLSFDFDKGSHSSPVEPFHVVLGNPPFKSKLTNAGKRLNQKTKQNRVKAPDNQVAYLVAEQAMRFLHEGGRLCLIQPAGLLYNEKTREFRQYLLTTYQAEYALDFTSIRGLFKPATKKKANILPNQTSSEDEENNSHTADTKIIVLVAMKKAPVDDHFIRHLTFRRTISVEQQIGFELDHYDYHRVSQLQALNASSVWKINLLGGGRLHALAARLREMGTLKSYLKKQGWNAGEGYIAGKTGVRNPAAWLTGKPLLPTEALTETGIDESLLKDSFVEEKLFAAPRVKERYKAPLMLIRENEKLPCDFWSEGFLAYKAQIVGITAPKEKHDELFHFYRIFQSHRKILSAFCLLIGTRAMVSKATAINKIDIDRLPWPQQGNSWDLAFWEQTLCDDLVNFMADYVRKGQKSPLLQNSAEESDLNQYTALYCRMLGSIYDNLRAGLSMRFNGLICQSFYFEEEPQLSWLNNTREWLEPLQQLVYVQRGDTLRTARMVRIYDANVILTVKPDRLRYWIPSTAIRDADETLTDLFQQGY